MKIRHGAALAALALGVAAAPAAAHDGDGHAAAIGKLPGSAFGPLAGSLPLLASGAERVGGDTGFPGGHVAIQGDRLYLGSYGVGMRIYDIGGDNAESPKLLGKFQPLYPRADAPPDAMSYTTSSGEKREIAVLNGTRRNSRGPDDVRTDRTEFFDVTDPANPELLATMGPDQVDGESHNGDIVDERMLYLPSGGSGAGSSNGGVSQGLRIYDLKAFLAGDVDKPENVFRGDPVEMWETSPHRGEKPVGKPFSHTHDITIYTDYPVRQTDGTMAPRDIALLAEGGSYLDDNGNTGSMFVIDITDPAAPVVLQRWLHETGSAHHPIRYHHEAQFVDGLDRPVVLVTDEDMHNRCGGAGGVTAVELTPDLTGSKELSEWFIPAGTPAAVCSVHVFDSQDGVAYFGSYNAGLQVVDYSNPAEPKQIAYAIEPGATAWGADIHEGLVYVGDMARGLDVFRVEQSGEAKGKKKGKEKGKGKGPR